jgi:hypothetical protein
MPDSNPELLHSLGRLVRGLSALFWGLPLALIVCFGVFTAGWFKPFGIVPPLAVNGLLLFGIWQLDSFQKQERPWRATLQRSELFALINVGLSPFLYWQNQIPENHFFVIAVYLLGVSAFLFLFTLNLILLRLGAMLPDETLRQETRQFTAVNRSLLTALFFLAVVYLSVIQIPDLPENVVRFLFWLDRAGLGLLIFLILLPLAMTMALIWKAKEVVLDSVFGGRA